jgi:predicted DCC family thiol-disulfide oxidoreductase YuxK
LTRADADRAAWAVAGGRRYAGAGAINRVLAELPRWRTLALLYRVPPFARVEDRVYAWIAANRHRFHRLGTVPECSRPGIACTPPSTLEVVTRSSSFVRRPKRCTL